MGVTPGFEVLKSMEAHHREAWNHKPAKAKHSSASPAAGCGCDAHLLELGVHQKAGPEPRSLRCRLEQRYQGILLLILYSAQKGQPGRVALRRVKPGQGVG